MEILDKLKNENVYSVEFAVLNIEKSELTLCKEICKTTQYVSLKNVIYKIIDGILYLEGTRVYFNIIDNNYNFYNIPKEYHKYYDLTDVLLEKYIKKRWFKKDIEYDVIDIRKYLYLKLKEEEHFTYAMHPFKLKEF
jgi:hypothetical protein